MGYPRMGVLRCDWRLGGIPRTVVSCQARSGRGAWACDGGGSARPRLSFASHGCGLRRALCRVPDGP
jgi:hypothetical protein